MKKPFVFILLAGWLLGHCAHRPSLPYYSAEGLSYQETVAFSKGVPIYFSQELTQFLAKADTLSQKDLHNSAALTGYVRCQPVIDAQGRIKAIRILHSLDSVYDCAVLNAVKKFRFKPLTDPSGQKTHYSVLVDFFFYQGRPFYPFVNFKNTCQFFTHLAPTGQNFTEESYLTVECVVPFFDAYFSKLLTKIQKNLETALLVLKVQKPHWAYSVSAVKIASDGSLQDLVVLLNEGNDFWYKVTKESIQEAFPSEAFPAQANLKDVVFLLTLSYPIWEVEFRRFNSVWVFLDEF